uniref:Uncharacterized protein n=1 Tax=Hippocampus comes TaxID=109280 RepID=A0A3Q2XLA4_HIPCM
MTQSLAKKLALHNIYLGVVAPSFTETEMAAITLTPAERENLLRESPFKRMAQPDEVAHAILFLASEGAEYSSGTIIDVNGSSLIEAPFFLLSSKRSMFFCLKPLSVSMPSGVTRSTCSA